MIHYLRHHQIDFEQWDDCINKSTIPLVYAKFWYLNTLTKNHWDALVLNDYEAVMPLCKKSKLGIEYLYQPIFAQQLGIFSKVGYSNSLIKEFITHIPKKFKFIDIQLNLKNDLLPKVNTIFVKENVNVELSLNEPYTKLFSNYSDNLKRNLKKVYTQNLVLDFSLDFQPTIALFKKYKGLQYPEMQEHVYENLAHILEIAITKNCLKIVQVKDKFSNSLLAGAFFLIDTQRLIFLFSGISEEGKQQRAMFYLLDTVIKEYANSPKILDFEGSNDEQLARFYKGFGGKELKYFHLKINRLPAFLKWIKK
ncbi:MAG: hypothetical protein EAZ07_06450 [Cytophagales bacterium]|nr:MAG: hypothetical protein EAZ07_06450 [Cytophagales bacterium]